MSGAKSDVAFISTIQTQKKRKQAYLHPQKIPLRSNGEVRYDYREELEANIASLSSLPKPLSFI
jgi:hypothetical protein